MDSSFAGCTFVAIETRSRSTRSSASRHHCYPGAAFENSCYGAYAGMGNFISRSWGAMEDEAAPPTRAMGDETAPPMLRNRAAHPERGYPPEPGIDAALGGAFNTSGKSNLPAEEVNEVTDTEDEDQELTPPGASANDREEQPEAPNVQSQGQTLGEHDHEVETVAAVAGDQATAQEAADALRRLLLRPCPAVETVASGATPSPTPLCGAALAAESKERDYTKKMYAVMMVIAWCIFGAIFVGFVYTFILRIPRFLALVVWAIVVPVGAIWLARFYRQSKVEGENKNENENEDDRIQYSIVRRFCWWERVYKQKVYETEEAARKAWKKNDRWLIRTWYSSVMFKLWVNRSGLVRYETEDSYGTAAATKDIKDAFEKDSKVGLDVNHSNVKRSVAADTVKGTGAAIVAIVGVYFAGKAAGKVAGKVGDVAGKAAGKVGDVAGKAADKVGEVAGKAADRVAGLAPIASDVIANKVIARLEEEIKLRIDAEKHGKAGGFMTRQRFRELLDEAGLLTNSPGKVGDGQDVFHIIASSNGGPDHVDNYLYALGAGFNRSIGANFDHVNCFMAGKEKAKRAATIALTVANDKSLHKHIKMNVNGERTLFTEGLHRAVIQRTPNNPDAIGEALYNEGKWTHTTWVIQHCRA